MPIMHDSDRYDFVRDIGSGNFGVARLMRDKHTKELVAVKYIERGEKVNSGLLINFFLFYWFTWAFGANLSIKGNLVVGGFFFCSPWVFLASMSSVTYNCLLFCSTFNHWVLYGNFFELTQKSCDWGFFFFVCLLGSFRYLYLNFGISLATRQTSAFFFFLYPLDILGNFFLTRELTIVIDAYENGSNWCLFVFFRWKLGERRGRLFLSASFLVPSISFMKIMKICMKWQRERETWACLFNAPSCFHPYLAI